MLDSQTSSFPLPTFEKLSHDYDIQLHQPTVSSYLGCEYGYLKRYFSIYTARANPNSKFGNQLVYVAPNEIALLSLSRSHPLILLLESRQDQISHISVTAHPSLQNNKVQGKKKKEAKQVLPYDPILLLQVRFYNQDEEDMTFEVGASIPAKVLELQTQTLERPKLEQFLGIQNHLAVLLSTTSPSTLLQDTQNYNPNLTYQQNLDLLTNLKLNSLPKKLSKVDGSVLEDRKSFLAKIKKQSKSTLEQFTHKDGFGLHLELQLEKFAKKVGLQ